MCSDKLCDQSAEAERTARPPDFEVRAQINRILKSKVFSGSDRLRRFLTWTVEQLLQGGVQNIKQYSIGQEVFDRGPEFDPRIDSIVRTEAQRLRRKLSEYYLSEGSSDSILVWFEPGSYVPVLRNREPSPRAPLKEQPQVISVSTRPPATAVLPFLNLSTDADQDYFCRGIAESIQERLANSPRLRVISTSSAFRFGAEEQDFTRIGRELGVNTIVEGSVQQSGTRIRVHAKAVDLASGSYIWVQVFDREIQDVFAIQDEIARAVAQALTDQPAAEHGNRAPVAPSADAYRLYLRGRHFWNKLTVGGCEQAVECFRRAISIAPDYAQVHAALADAYHWLIFFGVRSPASLAGVTRQLALDALRLDRHCAEAYITLAAETAALDWQWHEAGLLFRRGLELRPNYVPGYLQRAFCRMQQGDLEGSRADAERALDLDPLSPRSHRTIGIHLYLLRDFESAIVAFERAGELGPHIRNTDYYRGLALLQDQRLDEAVAALSQSLEPSPSGPPLGALVAAYAAAGFRQKANEALRQLHELSGRCFVPPSSFVHAYASLDQPSEALDWLERAADERCTGLMLLKFEPLLDRLREEPRFQAVLRQANLV